MHRKPTAAYLLLETRLGSSLTDHVREARVAGQSWGKIAEDLRDVTGAEVTSETLRNWFPEYRDVLALLRAPAQAAS